MAFHAEFVPLALADLKAMATSMKADRWRYVQTLAVNTEEGIDLIYSFMKNGNLINYQIKAVTSDDVVPSITDQFLEAFVFENEIHDLFGVDIQGIAIDFGGHFYQLSVKEPMTVISPAQLAAREKAKKVAAAKAAKERAKKDSAKEKTEEDLEAKLASMDPEKAAKVRAAMEAKAKREAEELEAKLASMDPDKAAKVRAAMEAKAKRDAEKNRKAGESE